MEVGYCSGIENYSRHLAGRKPGETPTTLLDFFPQDSLLILDESHVSVPQIRGMFAGDFSRKSTLVEHGFRLPSAIDNRPLRFDEWEQKFNRRLFVSATPSEYEVAMSGGEVVEQVIRPTGLVDPIVRVEPARGQVPALLGEVKTRAGRGERVLITTLTKRLAEDLSRYLKEQGLRCKWLHSELDAFERVTILRELREGAFDALVGVNLLREGLDLPEVSMVCILDADKEGFLRSDTSLIQTIGRSARHANAEVILYADKVTNSMQRAIDETQRRRMLQLKYNAEHGITPETIKKAIRRGIEEEIQARGIARRAVGRDETTDNTEEYLSALEAEMLEAAEKLEFERAAALRDKILELRSADADGPRRPAASLQAQECAWPRQSPNRSAKTVVVARPVLAVKSTVSVKRRASLGIALIGMFHANRPRVTRSNQLTGRLLCLGISGSPRAGTSQQAQWRPGCSLFWPEPRLAVSSAIMSIGCDSSSTFLPPPPEGLRGAASEDTIDVPVPPGLEGASAGARSVEMILDRRDSTEIDGVIAAARMQAGIDKVKLRPKVLGDTDPPAHQVELVREAIARQPLALIVEPADPTDIQMAEALQKARADGIPVVLVNRPLSTSVSSAGAIKATDTAGKEATASANAASPGVQAPEVRRCQAVRAGRSAVVHRVGAATRNLGNSQRQERATRSQRRRSDLDQHRGRPLHP